LIVGSILGAVVGGILARGRCEPTLSGFGIGPNNIATSREVKARAGAGYGDPWEAVGPEKERRLRRAAEGFLARNPALLGLEIAFEVAAVRGRRIERVPL
jgi:hypothetical protein